MFTKKKQKKKNKPIHKATTMFTKGSRTRKYEFRLPDKFQVKSISTAAVRTQQTTDHILLFEWSEKFIFSIEFLHAEMLYGDFGYKKMLSCIITENDQYGPLSSAKKFNISKAK